MPANETERDSEPGIQINVVTTAKQPATMRNRKRTSQFLVIRNLLSLFVMLCVTLLFQALAMEHGNSQVAKEYQIKAVFLYNFSNFIRWPDSAFDSPEAAFNICILGEDPFQQVIDITTEDVTTQDKRPIEILRVAKTEKALACHILFISKSEAYNVDGIIREVGQYAILTVSDLDSFMERCGMIRFFIDNDRIRLEINRDKLESVGLKADANLLNLSRIYAQSGCEP